MPKPNKGFPIVEIEWFDAHSSLTETDRKSASKNKPILTKSVGYLVNENEDGVTLVSDTWPEDPERGFAEHFVGWGMIRKIWVLNIEN